VTEDTHAPITSTSGISGISETSKTPEPINDEVKKKIK
jgi:hypothetical protein